MGWNRYCTQLILYLELLNRWTESVHGQHIKENILNMPVFQITILICFQSVILYITKMRFLHEVSYLFLKAEKYLSIKIQPPMKAICTCQAKALSYTLWSKQNWSVRGLPELCHKLRPLHRSFFFFLITPPSEKQSCSTWNFTSRAPQLTLVNKPLQHSFTTVSPYPSYSTLFS